MVGPSMGHSSIYWLLHKITLWKRLGKLLEGSIPWTCLWTHRSVQEFRNNPSTAAQPKMAKQIYLFCKEVLAQQQVRGHTWTSNHRASNCGISVFVELVLQWFEQKSYLNRDNTCLELSTPAKFGSKHKMENIVFIGSAAIWSVAAAENHVMGGKKKSIYTETETRPTSHVKPEEDQGSGYGSLEPHLPL